MVRSKKQEIDEFSSTIESLRKRKNISYMDAIVDYCQTSGLEVEIAAKLINSNLKGRIKQEAEELHFLPKTKKRSKLPI